MRWLRRKTNRPPEPPDEILLCSFCNSAGDVVEKLFAGPNGLHICNKCLDLCHDLILDFAGMPPIEQGPDEGGTVCRCSFCGKDQNEVKLLIAGPAVNICNDCTERLRGSPG